MMCTAKNCDRPARTRSLCHKHYERLRRHGRVELPTTEQRFYGKVATDGDCWVWMAGTHREGYGWFRADGRDVLAHRWSYEFLRSPIPEGLVLDHLCRVRACVNPWHLEPVSDRTNIKRGEGLWVINSRKTHCIRDHEFTPANTGLDRRGNRYCKSCRRILNAQSYARKKARAS